MLPEFNLHLSNIHATPQVAQWGGMHLPFTEKIRNQSLTIVLLIDLMVRGFNYEGV